MGVDYRNVIMYGKEFDSFSEALEFLAESGRITEEQMDEWESIGEPYGIDLEYTLFNAWNSDSGVLGIEFSAKELLDKPSQFLIKKTTVEGWLEEGCDIHEFVSVY